MHSKWKLWDFLKNHKTSLGTSLGGEIPKGFFLFLTFDPVCERFIVDHLPHGLLKPSAEFFTEMKRLTGAELSVSLLEEELLTPSLFGNSDTLLVYFAQDISEATHLFLKKIMESHPEVFKERTIIFFYTKKNKDFDRLASYKDSYKILRAVTIEATTPWESEKILDFLSSYYQIKLSWPVKKEILSMVAPDFSSLDQALLFLKLYFEDGPIENVDIVKQFLLPTYIDQFKLADEYSLKKRHEFFYKLINLKAGDEDLRSFLGFMQSHILKLLDLSYVEGKKALSGYDKRVNAHAKLWTSYKLMEDLKLFQELEIMAKMKDQNLSLKLKEIYMDSFQEDI